MKEVYDMKDWFNDGVWKCEHCGEIFKVYALGNSIDVQQCPFCCVTGTKLIPCDENGNED